MDLRAPQPPLLIVVGAGGVGKTTLAASLGLVSAEAGHDTLVMTFDPSRRLKDALGVGEAAVDAEVPVVAGTAGQLAASLLDARRTFDRIVGRYAPDEAARRRILDNPTYAHLAGHLGGILEYMAVERLYEVAATGRYARVVLDTPPSRQAVDFLEAPRRIVDFLDSGALRLALRPWFDDRGRLRPTSYLGPLGRGLEQFLDRIVGLRLLRDVSEFFRAFEPLFEGFRRRASRVEELLVSPGTVFVLVSSPSEERLPDTLRFARRLRQAGCHLGPIVVNRVHPVDDRRPEEGYGSEGRRLLAWLGGRDRQGVDHLRRLVGDRQPVVAVPLEACEPIGPDRLLALGRQVQAALVGGPASPTAGEAP